MSTPPYVAGCIFTVAIGIISDHLKLRGPFVILCTLFSIAGYAILYAAPANKPGLSYAGMIIVAIGGFPTIPVILAWAGGNAGGDIKRGVTIAMIVGISNLGGLVDYRNLTMLKLTAISEYAHHFCIVPKTLQGSFSDIGPPLVSYF